MCPEWAWGPTQVNKNLHLKNFGRKTNKKEWVSLFWASLSYEQLMAKQTKEAEEADYGENE